MVASELTASAKAMGSIPVDDTATAMSVDQFPSAPLQNRASQSLSPFVQSYANSPVTWQLLDNATVERAKEEHKLIFMHIGYKACHRKSSSCLLSPHGVFATSCSTGIPQTVAS